MFNGTIFKQTLRGNFKLWLIITLVLCVFNVVLIAVFDPTTLSEMTDMVENTALENVLGSSTLLGMLSQTFFSLQGVILPLIYIIITANSLIVSQVDSGSMAYLLSTPIKRSTVVITQIVYFVTALLLMFVIVTVVGIISIQAFQEGVDVDMTVFLMLNLGLFLLMFATSSISFMFSCIFNLSKNYMILGGGIPVAFLLFDMMVQVNESLEPLKYLTMNTLYDKDAILASGDYLINFAVMAVIGVVLYIVGIQVFKSKDLPL